MTTPPGDDRQQRLRQALKQDLARHARREPGHRSLWQSLALVGGVGWPIAIASVGGAFLGRYIDLRWETGVQFTLIFLVVGASLGSWIGWRLVSEVGKR